MTRQYLQEDKDYDEYLASLHSGLNTPEDLTQEVVKEATGDNFILKERIIAGEVNEVYDITLQSSKHVIVRISHKNDPSLEKEIWICKKCKEVDVPVPNIFLVKYVQDGEKGLTFSVMEKIEGEPLERGNVDFKDLDKNLLSDLMKKSGSILSKIHSITFDGFGHLDKNGNTSHATYTELRLRNAVKEDVYMELAKKVSMQGGTMRKILTTLITKVPKYNLIKSSLNHRDFAPKHIMFRDSTITGIIDWQDAEADSPIFDFARWEYWFDEIPISMLMEGYDNQELFDDSFEEHKQLIKLDQGLEVLHWYDKVQYQSAINQAVIKLERDIEFFK
jgi:aminoglycoside phosphotransferase (APT) family kinase protein